MRVDAGSLAPCEFADGRSETSPVSKDIEPVILSGIKAKLSERKANSRGGIAVE